jgi:hypothetical protein
MAYKIYLTLDRNNRGAYQIGIMRIRPDGSGTGYRILGPDYDGDNTEIAKRELTFHDAQEIRKFLDEIDGGPFDDTL